MAIDLGWRNAAFYFLKSVTFLVAVFFLIISCSLPCFSSEPTKDVYEKVREGFYSFSESIDIREYEILPDELTGIVASVIKDDPYLFFVDGNMSYSYEPGGFVISLKPKYTMRGEEVFLAWDFCRQMVRELAKEADRFQTDAQKALYLHDAICLMTEYDGKLENDDLYDLFVSGRATCQGYTAAYLAALRECGIEAHFVASDSIEHIWNCVKIDGEWYHVDLTWDDSKTGDSAEVSRRHFLLSDADAERKGHKDWYSVSDFACKSDSYSECDFDLLLHSSFKKGDVDHDCALTLADILVLRRDGEGSCLECADVDGNGEVDIADLELIRQKLLFFD